MSNSVERNSVDNSSTSVSPEMLDAGFRVLSTSGIADEYLEADRLLLADIYRAMFAVALSSMNHRRDGR